MLVEFKNFLSSLKEVSDITIEQDTISFQYKELFFLFAIDETDPYYIRLILPNIATLDNLKEGIVAHVMVNDYNSKFKTVKMCLWNNFIWLSIEQFIYSKEKATELFSRMINILVSVITEFRNENLR